MRMHKSLGESETLNMSKNNEKSSRLRGRNKTVLATVAAPLSDQLDEAFARGNWKKNKSGPKGSVAPSKRMVEALNKISEMPIDKSELINKTSGKIFGSKKLFLDENRS